MFTRFNQNLQIVLLDKNVKISYIEKNTKIVLILSPTYYWVKKFDLPTKNKREIRKLLPSLFEEFLPNGEYSYDFYFENEKIIAFAYDDSYILKEIAKHGIDISQVKSIKFAQTEFGDNNLAYKIDNKTVLTKQDSIIIKVPIEFVDEVKETKINNIKLSNHNIALKQFSKIIDIKSIYILFGVFFMFIIIYGYSLSNISKKIEKLQEQKSFIFKKYNLLKTSFQNKSLYKEYKKIDKKQKRFKEILSKIIMIRFDKGEFIDEIKFQKNKLYITFKQIKNKNKIINTLKSYGITKQKYKNKILTLEIKI